MKLDKVIFDKETNNILNEKLNLISHDINKMETQEWSCWIHELEEKEYYTVTVGRE